MEVALLKTNILAIVASGLAMALLGMVLYFFREAAAPYMRFLLTIPPVGVAAYIYIFNMFRKFNGSLPRPATSLFIDMFVATGVAAIVFLVFSVLLLIVISLFNHT